MSKIISKESRIPAAFVLALGLALGHVPEQGFTAPKSQRVDWNQTIDIRGDVDTSYCSNTTPFINFGGDTIIQGTLQAEVYLKKPGTKSEGLLIADSFAFTLATGQQGVTRIAKQPPLDGVGGNPFIGFFWSWSKDSVTVADLNGNPIDPPGVVTQLGRCVQSNTTGPQPVSPLSGKLRNIANLIIGATECSNSQSTLSVSGSNKGGSSNAASGIVRLSNSLQNDSHVNTDLRGDLTFQPVLNGEPVNYSGPKKTVGGNPYVYVKFKKNETEYVQLSDPKGNPLVDKSGAPVFEAFLGRCKDLM